MIRKLMICPWFGPLPEWMTLYRTNIARQLRPHGYTFLFVHDLGWFKQRVKETFNIDAPIVDGGSKIHDYRAAFGHLFADELQGFDFWGHTDFDCVYGRVHRWVTDEFLNGLDLHSNHATYVAGPWTLYRNTPRVNDLYQSVDGWRDLLQMPETTGWVEQEFSRAVEHSLQYRYTSWQVYLPHELAELRWVHWAGSRLMRGEEEVMMAHFRRTKVYPKALR